MIERFLYSAIAMPMECAIIDDNKKNGPNNADVWDAEVVFIIGGKKSRCVRVLGETYGTHSLGRKAKLYVLIGSVRMFSCEEKAVFYLTRVVWCPL